MGTCTSPAPFHLSDGGPLLWPMWREPGAPYPATVGHNTLDRPEGAPASEKRM